MSTGASGKGLVISVCLLLVLLLTIAVGSWLLWSAPTAVELTPSPPAPRARLAQARLALARGDFEQAETLALTVAHGPDADGWAWMVAAEAAVRREDFSAALEHYEQVVIGELDLLSAGAHGRGEMLLHLGNWKRAEAEFQSAINANPRNLYAQRRLADLYNLSGRRHRAVPLMEELLPTPLATLDDLFYLGDVDHGVQVSGTTYVKHAEPQTDPLILIGLGSEALAENRNLEAAEHFRKSCELDAENPDAIAGLGQALFLLESAELAAWRRQSAEKFIEDAGVMAVFGQMAERAGSDAIAVECFAQAAAKRPQSRIAWHRLGLRLSSTGNTAAATLALDQAQRLQELALWLDDLFQHRDQLELVRRVVSQLASMGRTSEAAAWSQYALSLAPQTPWAQKMLQHLEQAPESLLDGPKQRALAALLQQFGSAEISVAVAPLLQGTQASATLRADARSGAFRFVDDAAAQGLHFIHRSARDAATPGARIIETTGGGVAVLDYDVDGWPDLYFPQGSATFPMPANNPDRDRLFRNRQGNSWIDDSQAAMIDDAGFGQGVSAGDFDHDGFPDLYVANYGVNRLLQNQGDGTFVDVTPAHLHSLPGWTTSCAIVDINADGVPDLFDVMYCRGIDVETRICEQEGQPRSCSPRAFAAAPDRLWLGDGVGGFALTSTAELDLADGLGLGLVAFRPNPESSLTLFVANDESPNFWLKPRLAKVTSPAQFFDAALVSGLAVDAEGKPQACMGVACDDIDGNGLPDLFVTNFYHESNTLYLGITPEFFEDRTRQAALRDAGWNQLGFGCQFLDVDLDSWPDLIVANGHIDDLTALGQPFQMPVQCFRNQSGRFVEQPQALTVPNAIGRALARLDWNRDGREDVIIVNQDSPVTLLTNATPSPLRSLRLSFRGTASTRDALGVIVHLTMGERRLVRQLTAGDGYMASNERQLVVGLDQSEQVDALEIFWPSGLHQSIGPVRVPASCRIVEGQAPRMLDR